MYYVAMTSLENCSIDRGHGNLPLVVGDKGPTEGINVHVKDSKILVDTDHSSVNLLDIHGEDDNYVALAKVKETFKVAECRDGETPMFAVLCKGIKFYDKVRTYIRFIRVSDDCMLVALVYGACEFEHEDGSFVPLQRLNSNNIENRKTKYLSAGELYKFALMNKGDIDRSYDCVNALAVTYTETGFSSRAYIEECTPIDIESLKKKEQAAKYAENARKAKIEADRLEAQRRKENWQKSMEERRKAEAIAAAEAEAEKAEKAERRRAGRSKTTEIKGTVEGNYNAGAAAFLAYIQKARD